MNKETALKLISSEYDRAIALHGAFNSCHEGYAVILEELDELKAEVWKRASEQNPERVTKEAVQVGAMALRFLCDLCPEPSTAGTPAPSTTGYVTCGQLPARKGE